MDALFVKSVVIAVALPLAALTAMAAQDPPPAEPPLDIEAASSFIDYRNNTAQLLKVRIVRDKVTITADEATGTDMNFDNSHWIFTGSVHVTTDRGVLRADKADANFRDNRIANVTIYGSEGGAPATFEQKMDNTLTKGQAGQIKYDVATATVRLEKDAWLTDGQRDVRTQTIVYSINDQRVIANPDEQSNERVRITIIPDAAKKETPPQ